MAVFGMAAQMHHLPVRRDVQTRTGTLPERGAGMADNVRRPTRESGPAAEVPRVLHAHQVCSSIRALRLACRSSRSPPWQPR